ncbi:membrane fusion-like protein [Shewanella sp. MEBiC00475]|uniref:membrane fusion-like protein n=1 Tax=Shewanella sp. MEBiC00475 TaxID=2575361 RepID=UPI0010C122A3|nr:membrane fusion-like protein [Shewanella sp. MEBiC00475]
MMAKFGTSLLSITICLSSTYVCAESISLTALGHLDVSYISPKKVASYEGSPLPAQIARLPGNDYRVMTPENIQQVTFLVGQGEIVTKGQAIVKLTGPEVFHFLAQIEAAKSLYDLAQQRYDRNKPLLKNGSISTDKWREISQDYFSSHLEYEHMQHFMEMVQRIDAVTESLVVIAPVAGIVNLNHLNSPYSAGTQLFSLIPAESIRVKVSVPMSQSTSLSAVNINQCHIAIDEVSAIADGVFLTAWSMPIPKVCNLLLGQQITVIPEYQKAVYLVPKNSVFTWMQDSQIFTQTAQSLSALNIDILGSTPNEYIVASDQDLSQMKVLSQSVAAVKGILLGLGGE